MTNKTVRTFEEDHRQSNPGLHNLHVEWAYEDLSIVFELLERLYSQSRIGPSIWAGTLMERVRADIERDAAYFEAAALLKAGIAPPRHEEHEEQSFPVTLTSFEDYLMKNQDSVLLWLNEQVKNGKLRKTGPW